jgi:antitoxin MazE
MKVALVPIGNSMGIRIPRSIIAQCGFGDQVEMRVSEGMLVLSAIGRPREHWDEDFERTAASGDDTLLVPDTIVHEWDEGEWQW